MAEDWEASFLQQASYTNVVIVRRVLALLLASAPWERRLMRRQLLQEVARSAQQSGAIDQGSTYAPIELLQESF